MISLNQHLKNQDQADAESGAVDMLVDQWLSHPEQILTAWMAVLMDLAQQEIVADLLTHYSLRSGRFLGFDESSAQSLLIDSLNDIMVSELRDMALDHLKYVADQNKADAALDAKEDKYL